MLKGKVFSVQENQFKDRNDETKMVTMYKVTVLTDEGIIEMWSDKPYNKGADVQLVVKVGKNYKPVVKFGN